MYFLKFKKRTIVYLCIMICCTMYVFLSKIYCANVTNDNEYCLCDTAKEILQQNGIKDYKISNIDYSDISYEDEVCENVDEMVEEYIKDDLQSAMLYIDVKGREIIKRGDFISLKITVDGITNEDKMVVGKRNYGKKFDKWILGKKRNKRYLWKDNYEVEVVNIQKIKVPKLDKSFVKKNYGFASVNEYKDYVVSKMKEQSEGEALAKRDKQIIDCVVNSSDIELDDEQIAKYAKATYDGHLEQAEGFGLNLETYAESFYEMTLDEFNKYCYEESVNTVKSIICVGCLVNEFGINADTLNAEDTSTIYEELKGEVIQCLIAKEK